MPPKSLGKSLDKIIPKGRGLESMIPTKPRVVSVKDDAAESPFREVALKLIRPCADQPRKYFDEDKLDELAASIKAKGILQPLLVRTVPGGYELISGERRWRAAKKLGLEAVPVMLREVALQEQLELALIENIQRADLDPMEEAQAFAELIDRFSITQEALATQLGRSRSSIANSLRLLKLPDKVKDALGSGAISVGHAKVLLGEPMDRQLFLLARVVKGKLTVRELEKLVVLRPRKARSAQPAKKTAVDASSPILGRLEEALRQRLGTQVKIQAQPDGNGSITIDFYSEEQLDELYQKLTGSQLTRRKIRGI